MSASPPRADILRVGVNVGKVPGTNNLKTLLRGPCYPLHEQVCLKSIVLGPTSQCVGDQSNGGFALWGKTIRIGNLKQGDSATPALVLAEVVPGEKRKWPQIAKQGDGTDLARSTASWERCPIGSLSGAVQHPSASMTTEGM